MKTSEGFLPILAHGGIYHIGQKLGKRWDIISRIFDIVLMSLGSLLCVVCRQNLTGSTARHGQWLGAVSIALGLVGYLSANGRDHLPLRSLLLVGLAFSGVSSATLVDEASRDLSTHCALAEAHTRIRHLEDTVTKLRHDELVTQLFFRLNEMDDMLGMVQQGAQGVAELHGAAWSAEEADKQMIRNKVAALRRHTATVAAELRAKAQDMKLGQAGVPTYDEETRRQAQQQLWVLEKRVEAVDSVARYLDNKGSGDDAISYEEYEIVLEALLEGAAGSASTSTAEALRGEKRTAEALKQAYDRKQTKQYGSLVSGGSHRPVAGALQQLQQRKENARKEFEGRFMGTLQGHVPHHPSAFKTRLVAALDELPGHCLRDVDGYKRLKWVGGFLMAAQLLTGYSALTAFVYVAKKSD